MRTSPRSHLRPLLAIAALAALLPACASEGFRHGIYYGNQAAYRVERLQAPWTPVSFSGNDLAWAAPEGEMIAVNATCEGYGDPSLQVLSRHLLIGFTDRKVRSRENFTLDGRAAQRVRVAASIDGVPVEMEFTILKKDGCVYDLTYTSPPDHFEARLAEYHELVKSFAAVGSLE